MWCCSVGRGDGYAGLVVVVMSIFVVATSCLKLFGLLRCSGCMSFELSLFSMLIDVCTTAIHVVCFTCCVLDSDGAGYFCFEIGSWCLAAFLSGGLGVSLVDWGLGVPVWFDLEVWWPIAFDSRLIVSSSVHVWFLGCYDVLSVDQRLCGGGS
ncbi:transmembrane protein, putative [Medicago truncatula]|uniref:Transmembrane protein, putative n=1 Tax=Medicago truncatula TaxID=3880 RepID=A0A072V9W9_MEDTR|nr:transmembrane protein, putative [Medicago truncatula]